MKDWNQPLEVTTAQGYEETLAEWLGHASYRCGACRKGYFRARGPDDHDEECPGCKRKVHVQVRYVT